ncbi:MAG: addiction module protein [Halothiobacillaceae bacterium]
MTSAVCLESIEHAALSLAPSARIRLAHQLLDSLMSLPEANFNALWLDEAEYRDAQIESGMVQLVSAEDVLQRMRAQYAK